MKRIFILIIPVVLTSCALFGPRFHRTSFNYQAGGSSYSIPIIVPPGFLDKQTSADSLGNYGVMYRYRQGEYFILYSRDTGALTMHLINEAENQPLRHSSGGLVYKGMDENQMFWRVIRHPHIRVGYHSIPRSMEVLFDSATNYAANRVR